MIVSVRADKVIISYHSTQVWEVLAGLLHCSTTYGCQTSGAVISSASAIARRWLAGSS